MARPKKTTTKKSITKRTPKKTTSKRTPSKKAPSKKAPSKKAPSKKAPSKRTPPKKPQANTSTASIKLLQGTTTRRPPNNPEMPQEIIDSLNHDFNAIKNVLDDYSQHLRALDRKRLNGVGVRKLGFIERAYELALENAEFLPHYLTLERFGADIQYFMDFRSLVDIVTQIREKLWNITIQSSDIAYTDALEFYSSVREAAKRRVDAAETIHNALSAFFRHHRGETEEPTEKEALRDFKGLQRGTHDGLLVIENRKPKLSGGKRKIIDESFKDTAQFRESEDGEIKE